MDIFIANASPSVQHFHFRIPEVKGWRKVEIGMGEQIKLKELTQPQIDAVIHQGGKYNMVRQDEADRQGRRFCGLVYAVDRAVTGKAIEKVFKYNMSAKIEEGRQFRKDAAIAESIRSTQGKADGAFPNLRLIEHSIQGEKGEIAEGYRTDLSGVGR